MALWQCEAVTATRTTRKPRPPVMLDALVDDPEHIRELVRANAPYWPVQRYINNSAEYAALSGDRRAARGDTADSGQSDAMFVAPVFRGNWALQGETLAGTSGEVGELLHHPLLVSAAAELFDGAVVDPHTIYVNATWQLPFPQGRGHTDIPTFRGFDRTEHDIAFLTIMGLSGLFEDERGDVATAVAWFHLGPDGGFEYWPDGAEAPSVIHEGDIDNTAVVGDNDFMWHRVRPTGDPDKGLMGLSLDAELHHVAGGTHPWEIRRGSEALAAFGDRELRISLSWKADVYRSAAQRTRRHEHLDDLDMGTVVERFREDLRRRGLRVELPADPEHDPESISLLAETYVTYPAG